MRPDMHNVIIERPRWNPGRNKYGGRANLPNELRPKFEGIKRPYQSRKGLTDLLGPLRRWLRSQRGRPWNDVYSEASAVIRTGNLVRAHLKTHLLQMVERHATVFRGEVFVIRSYGPAGLIPITHAGCARGRFYVHPENGLLEEIPWQPRKAGRDPFELRRAQTVGWLNETTLLRRCHGQWFECRMEKFPRDYKKGSGDSPWRFDLVARKMINRAEARIAYGRIAYCVAKRQLSRRELKQFGLSNAADSFKVNSERSGQRAIVIAC